ncbi:class I SAM-dependent methyltransferase [Compostibacter hankyongensis]|uniref:Class I SAM-dependent methyltransferase n=1 Tax=Compostibacter hankyongensis TaxID=1007089 RepID=A0ABP8G8I7_9BACT
MTEEKFNMFRNRLQKVARHINRQAGRQQISCYRIYDHDLPEFPFCIDRYGQALYVAEYRRRHALDETEYETWLEGSLDIISEVLGVPREMIFLKERRRKEGREGQYQKTAAAHHDFVVEEAGLRFRVNLSDYLDTGLFPDHRITRAMVREEAAGKKMLNLFCYTGAFSVYAAAGGAAEVTSVDLSNTYLRWAEDNMQLNGLLDPRRHHFIRADVKQYLASLRPGMFDLAVMDPPTFSNSKSMKDFLDIQRDHVTLLNQVLRAMRPGGVLYFSTNSRKFQLDALQIRARAIRDITAATTPFDFRKKLFRWCYRLEA